MAIREVTGITVVEIETCGQSCGEAVAIADGSLRAMRAAG
jgi:hypothetical protein